MCKQTISIKAFLITTIILFTSGCGGGDSGTPSSGSSGVMAPSSIIGYKLTQKVTWNDGKPTTIGVGKTVVYTYQSNRQVFGDGLVPLETTSWTYNRSGDFAEVRLNYTVGYSEDALKFSTATSGTFESFSKLNTGLTGLTRGTFVITPATDAGTSGSNTGSTSGGTTSTQACETNGTGQLAVYTTTNGGTVDVYIDSINSGKLTQYFSGTPSCGDSGTITETVSAGNHTVEGISTDGRTWTQQSYNIKTCGCQLVNLR